MYLVRELKTAPPIYDDVFVSFRSLCAFLNSGKCGTVYFGIRRDGVVAGLKISRKEVSPGALHYFYCCYCFISGPIVSKRRGECEGKHRFFIIYPRGSHSDILSSLG